MAASPTARAAGGRAFTGTEDGGGVATLGDSMARPRSRSTLNNGGAMGGSLAGGRRMSMPQQQRQSSLVLSPARARGRTTSGAAMAGQYDGYDDEGEEDDEDDDRVHNLTFDGVKEGSYMLCKRSDDLLGHHARQVFREKAASMRGENSIYYYLKDLMKKFGSAKIQKKALTSEQIVLEPHEFRKLIASDAAFQSAIPEEHIDALFHRLEHDNSKLVRHLDFVEFCLFDNHQLRLLLFKFRKRLRKMRLTDNEITDTFRRLTSTSGMSISSELLHAAVARELDVVLTTGELRYLLQLMDLDGDGSVKVNDFEVFVKDDRASFELVHPPAEHGVVDLKLSVNEVEEANLKREGFTQLHPTLHDERVHLWYKTAPREEGKSAVTNIRYAPSARDSDLVSKGFACLQQDVNRSGAFGKHKYIWLSYVPPNVQSVSEIIDLCLSSGEQDDKKDAKLWLPMHRGFKLVPGDLNDRSSKAGVFLWIRRRPILAAEDLADASPAVDVSDSPRATTKLRKHVDELEAYVRQMLRRNCPVEQDGSINFARLFDEFDQKKSRAISKQAMHAGVESFGIKMKLKDFPLVWDRINPCGKKAIDVATLSEFLEMTDAEIDGIVASLQRTMTTKSAQQQQMPNYRLIFQSYNSLGDGRLSRADFQRLLAGSQINFTNAELSKMIQRFDVNKDGVVDYSDFLRYVTGICDDAARRAQRVANAAEDLKTWAMEKQNKKLAKDGQIDSSASWKLLRPKRGVVDISTIDHVLRERKTRLDSDHLRLLRVLIAPATNGEINQAAYHAFVNHQPRKLSTLVYDLKKIAGPTPDDGAPDGVYDRLNTEGIGRLSLVSFAKETNTFASEKNTGVGPFDLKDLVYIVQWTGADCGGDGTILIDRFLAAIRENTERRNMKHEFVTNYDSPAFIEGIKLLRDEMRRCAKTPDGKFNYRVPFQLFDKDKSGQIVLSEFEAAVRELGVDKFLTDQEVKSLMRRFDLNSTGGINYDEFLRFNVVESSAKNTAQAAEVEPILHAIVEMERLTPSTISSFCSSIKRMFSILDKDTHGVVPVTQFVQTVREMGISLAGEHMEALAHAFINEDSGGVEYGDFCEALQRVCERSQGGVDQDTLAQEPAEVVALLCSLYREHHRIQHAHAEIGKPGFDLYKAFGITHDEKQRSIYLSPDELKEVLWASGSRHPFLREELESILRCFHSPGGGFNASTFCQFMDHGPVVLFHGGDSDARGGSGVLDGYVARLQDGIQTYLAAGGRNAEERLFQCFAEFDDDGSGTISQEEFVHVLHKAGLRRFLSPDDESLLLQFLDSNGDGVISYKEFVEFTRHGEKRLNAMVDHEHDDDLPPPRSQGSPGSRPPTASPPRSPRRPHSPSFTAKSSSPAKSRVGSPRSPPKFIAQIAKLNSKLRPEFPFEKYFQKYRHAATGDAVVKSRVFEKIMDKFLARLVEHNIAYNMQEVDADVLTRAYESTSAANSGAAVVRFDVFLGDLRVAQSRAATERWKAGGSDSSDDDDNGDLSCSSDEGASKSKRLARVHGILNDSIRRDHKAKHDFEALRAKIKTTMTDIDKTKRDKASEGRVFKTLASWGLRLKKKEAETLLGFLTAKSSGSKGPVYDLKQLGTLLNEQLGVLLGEKKPEAPTPSTQQPTSGAPKKDTASGVISTSLADKIYRCFIAAAQLNISGRKLLEKCDAQKTGMVTFLELQTVLRLMGCMLTDAEVNDIKTAFAGGTAGTINYRLLVRQLTKQLQPPSSSASAASSSTTSSASTAAKLQEHRPAPIQVAPLPAKKLGNDHPQKPLAASTTTSLPLPRPLTMSDTKRLDSLLRPYFQDLLTTRRIDTQSLLKSFEPYDMKGTGFVSPDAVYSVMRKYDIWLPDDMARNVLQRFTSATSGRFDYVEFSTSLGGSSSSSAGEPKSYSEATRGISKNEETRAPRKASVDDADDSPPKSKPLPHLERKQHAAPSEANARRASANVALGWSCPVCLHTQRSAKSPSCEICAAQNPASVEYETLLKCSACDFRNRASATYCDLCRMPLVDSYEDQRVEAAPSSPQKGGARKPSNLRLHITTTNTGSGGYDEGWLA